MGKKKAFTKSKQGAKNKKLDPFKVSDKKIKKKPKQVKSNLNKMKANVKVQQEKSDAKLKNLHADMVVKKSPAKPLPSKKKANEKKRTTSASTRPVRDKLQKMQVN